MFTLLLLSIIEFSHSKKWANERLHFGIKLLKGQICLQSFKRALSDAITIQAELSKAGFPWQADRLQNWINLARKKDDFIPDTKKTKRFTAHVATCDDFLEDKKDDSFVSSSWLMGVNE